MTSSVSFPSISNIFHLHPESLHEALPVDSAIASHFMHHHLTLSTHDFRYISGNAHMYPKLSTRWHKMDM